MRAKNSLIVSVVGCVLLLCSAHAFAAPLMGQVFKMNVVLTGKAVTNSVIVPQMITGNEIINIALGNMPIAPVPSNEVLALVIAPDAGVGAAIVLDTATSSNLCTVAGFTMDGAVAKTKGTAVLDGFIVAGGNITNGLTGGFLALSGKVVVNATNQNDVTSFKGSSIIGSLQGTMLGQPFDVVVTKAKISTVQKLSPMPVPAP
jgi:hypothetical protein